ncbi:serine hydrolase domain-containing protein [Streptomyces sp. NPDC002004]
MSRTPERCRPAPRSHRTAALGVLTAAGLLALTACTATATPPSGAAAAATGSPTASSATAPGRPLPAADAARLDRAIRQTMRQAGVPGVVVGLWMPGRGDYVRSFGVADKTAGTPMSDGLNMRIGSETKTFTVTAVLRLVDQGKVGIDDPVSRYVPGVPEGDRITLRRLADMRSGLYCYTSDPDFQKALFTDPDHRFTPRELLGYAFKHPNNFPPGERFQYCNTNAILLGLVVEKASGKPFGDFLAEQVLAPGRLGRTLLPTGSQFPDPHAHGYTNQTLNGEVADSTNWDPSWAWAAGAMISDLQDLRSWARILATGTLLKPATQAQRMKFLPSNFPGAGYGLGVFDVHGWIGHNGSLPGYESLTVYLPEQRATLVVLLNTDIMYKGNEPSSLLGKAITSIVTPKNVYDLPPAESTQSPSPTS